MARIVAGRKLEGIAAESEKFTSPLLFVHGLWGSASSWRRFMGYCAHRGWSSYAVTLPRSAPDEPPGAGSRPAEAWLEDLRSYLIEVVEAMPSPPILVGHDLGASLILSLSVPVRARVAMAPLWGRSLAEVKRRLCGGWQGRMNAWRNRCMVPKPGPAWEEYMALGENMAVTPEAARFLRALDIAPAQRRSPPDSPSLIIGGERDLYSRAVDVAALAAELSAECIRIPDLGHALPWGPGWERAVAVVHRWLVTTLGEGLLIVRDEEDDGEPKSPSRP